VFSWLGHVGVIREIVFEADGVVTRDTQRLTIIASGDSGALTSIWFPVAQIPQALNHPPDPLRHTPPLSSPRSCRRAASISGRPRAGVNLALPVTLSRT
jgi:hypothetical protein